MDVVIRDTGHCYSSAISMIYLAMLNHPYSDTFCSRPQYFTIRPAYIVDKTWQMPGMGPKNI